MVQQFPAQVFMGDTGSLAIGAIIAVLALAVRKEFLLPIIAGIFSCRESKRHHTSELFQIHQEKVW